MGLLQKLSSSFIGYYFRTFIYFHTIVFGLFGLGYLLYLIDFQITRPDIRSFFMSIFINDYCYLPGNWFRSQYLNGT